MASNPPYVQIPLYLVQISTGEIKVGIKIAINGGLAMLYELDTGASGFYPAAVIPGTDQGPPTSLLWWKDFLPTNNVASFNQNYSSGNSYTALATQATLTFEGYSYVYSTQDSQYEAQDVPSVTVNVGAIVDASNSNNSCYSINWNTSLTNANTNIAKGESVSGGPLDSYFFGDFGIGLGNCANDGEFQGGPVLAVLPQFPAPYCNQFTIDLGTLPTAAQWAEAKTGIIPQGTLTLGVPPTLPPGTPVQIYMNPSSSPQAYPSNTFQGTPTLFTFDQAQASATFTLGSFTLPNVPMVMDTGCPGMMIHLGGNGPLSLAAGGQIGTYLTQGSKKITVNEGCAVSFSPAITASFTAGTGQGDIPVTATELTANKPGKQFGYVNTSIKTFFDNAVTFNLLDGTLTLYPQS
jgi:hypothetical protein